MPTLTAPRAAFFTDHGRGVDVSAGVAFVMGQYWQEIEINLVAFQDHFFARRVLGGDFSHRTRIVFSVREVFHHLRHRGRAQRQRQALVRGAEIDHQRDF